MKQEPKYESTFGINDRGKLVVTNLQLDFTRICDCWLKVGKCRCPDAKPSEGGNK